jgi:hypothetical protein
LGGPIAVSGDGTIVFAILADSSRIKKVVSTRFTYNSYLLWEDYGYSIALGFIFLCILYWLLYLILSILDSQTQWDEFTAREFLRQKRLQNHLLNIEKLIEICQRNQVPFKFLQILDEQPKYFDLAFSIFQGCQQIRYRTKSMVSLVCYF